MFGFAAKLSGDARWHRTHHIDEHFTRPARMWASADLCIPMPAVKRDVSCHPHIRIKPNFCDTKLVGSLIGKVKERSSVASPLFCRPNRDAVDQKVTGTLFQYGNADIAPVARQEPYLAPLDPGPVILLGR